MTLMDILAILLVLALLAAAGFGIYYYFKKKNKKNDRSAPKAGAGEPLHDAKANATFVRKLKTSAWKRELPVIIPNPEKSPFCALLVSPSGVTAFYGADYTGTVYGGPDEQWAQIADNVRRPFRSPLLAAEDARKELRDKLSSAHLGAFMDTSRVVMTAPKAELCIPRNTGVFSVKDTLHDVEYSEELMTKRRFEEAKVQKFLEETYL